MALRIFIASLIGLLIFIGCGGGGGGGSGSGSGTDLSPVGPALVNGRIFGTIVIDSTVTSLRPDNTRSNQLFLDSYLFLEELPGMTARADNQGNFTFDNVPPGNYRIIARITSLTGRTFKARTELVPINSDGMEKRQNIYLYEKDLANIKMRLLVKDLQGNAVGRCKIKLWGEEFTLDEGGYYVSPAMPTGAMGTIKIEPPADKDLSQTQIVLTTTSFQKDNLAIVGLTLPTAGITNQAPQVSVSVDNTPANGSAFLRLTGTAYDPEREPLAIDWQTTVSTFSYKSDTYADWAIPSQNASATITYSAREDGFAYPRLTSTARLDIVVASGVVTFPDGIAVQPVNRRVEIIGTATLQIPGDSFAQFEAVPDFPAGLNLTYAWTADLGTIVSGKDQKKMIWRSPALGLGESLTVNISVVADDGIGAAQKQIIVKVTASPLALIERPVGTSFEPGLIEFFGSGRDYLNTTIPAGRMTWFLATGTADFAMQKSGTASFTYFFTQAGSYSVALQCLDNEGVIGTATKEIAIVNAKPVCVITAPADNSSFLANSTINFTGVVNDYEEGLITDAARIGWRSDIDGFLGSGSSLVVPILSSGRHEIRLTALDSTGLAGSSSIVIWYDLPARITFLPTDRSVIFAGNSISFLASGTDSDGSVLDVTKFEWYLNNQPAIWQTGESFVIASNSLVPGTYRVRVQGESKLGQADSPTHAIEVGWQLPVITGPASGTRFDPGTSINFTATPNSTGTLNLAWYLDDATTSFGSGQNVTYSPPNGAYRVSYRGADGQGFVGSAAIGIVVERPPIVNYTPADGAYIFAGHNITFNGNAIDTNNNVVPDTRLRWYIDGGFWRTGSIFTVSQGFLLNQLAPGTYQIALEAVGPYGTVATRTHNIRSGITLSQINTPANDSTFTSGTTINFSGVPDNIGPITMQWWANYGQPGATLIGEGANVSTNSLPDGYYNISYFGTDSTGFISSDSINLSVGQFPTMDFSPGAGTAFFAGKNVIFYGVGTDTLTGLPIPANRMAWYIDNTLKLASFSVFTVDPAMVTAVGPGLRQVELRGTNSINAVGKEIKSIYLGVANASISSPLNDTVIPESTMYSFTGTPDSTGPITMQWWLDYNTAGSTLLGNGTTLNAIIPNGNHLITYVGTDSAGVVSSATIRVIVSNSPAINFTPSNGSRLFVGQPFNLTVGGDVVEATARWYRDSETAAFKSGSPVQVNVGDLTVGLHQIKVEAQNSLGVSSNITNSIYYGVTLAQITAPASGSTFAIGSNVAFSGSPATLAPIDMQWYRSNGGAPVYMGNAASFNTSTIPAGLNTITYLGTDSAGYCSSFSIQILMNDSPTITFTPPADGVSDAVIFSGASFNLTGSGIEAIAPNPPINASTFKWYVDGTLFDTGSPATVNAGDLTVGWHTIDATGVDQYGTTGTGTHDIFYGHPLASVVSPASGTVFARGATVNCTGSAASATITMRWQLNGVDSGVTGQNYNPTPPDGWNTITYIGQDNANNTSSANIMVLMDDPPAMAFTPGNGSRFWAGSSPTFTGVGTGSIAAYSVPTGTMKWYANASILPTKSNSPATFNPADLLIGNNQLKLTGNDQFNVEGEVTYNFYYGHPLADITSPASGSTYSIGANINFTGTPDTTAPITMYWYFDYGKAGETLLGNGANLTYSFATRGVKTISYIGTDSAGLLSRKDIQVLINETPTMTIAAPVNNGKYFGGQILSVSGSGVDLGGSPISTSTLKWYRDGSLWKSAVANFSATIAELGTGTVNVRLDGTDAFGTTGTVTNTIQTGIDVPQITAPASGTRYALGSNVALTGFPDLTGLIPTEWYWTQGTAVFGAGPNATIATLPRGLHTLSYRGTDSAGTTRSGAIQVVLNNPQTVNIVTPINNGNYFGGQTLAFSSNSTDSGGSAVDTSTFKWFRDGTNFKNGFANFSASVAELPTGTLQIGLQTRDNLGTYNGATYTIEVGISHPSVTSPASGTRYALGSNVVLAGSPNLTGVINTEWYWVEGAAVFGAGPNASIATLTRGLQTLTYRGTDDAGTTRSGSIQVILNDAPTVNMVAPVNLNDYFGGQSLNFSANGTDSGGTAIPAANFKWYRDGTLFKTGFDSFAATVADLPTGTRQIAVQVRDGFNEYNGATVTIDVGFAIPSVTAPASGTRYALGTNLNLNGSPDLTGEFNTEWYWVEGAAVFGAGPSASIATLTRGLHTLTYRGTDDGGTTRSGSIQVIFNNPPTVNMVFPVDTDSYFGGQTLNFSANGTDSGGTAIPAANFKWYRDGTLFKTGFSAFTATIAELPTGSRDISVQVRDGFNEYNGATVTVDLGETLPTVSSPASGTKYALGANVPLTGSPDYTGKFSSDWYWTQGAAVFGGGPNASIATLTRGLHTLSYRGTDDNGTVRSGSIQIVLNNAPTAGITLPVNNGRYFGYQTLSFSGTGTDSGGGAIAAANFKWYRDTTNFKSGVDTFTATVAEMPTGTRDIGLQVKDEFNAYGGATYTIEVGVSHPTISSPASGATFAIGTNVNFVGNPDSGGPLTMEWYLDNSTLMGTGANISYAFPTRGLKTITYVGTDSAGLSKSKTIQILINNPPTFNITLPVNNGKYFGGQNINFSGSGTDSGGTGIAVASLRWYKNGTLYKSGTNSFAGTVAELPTGTINISLGGLDDLGTFNSATYTIQVGIGLPSITSPASGTRFDTGSTVSFTGTPDLTALIPTDWWWPEGTTSFGGGPTLNTAALTRGVQSITYIGTDSQNTARSSTIQVLIDKLPTFISKPFIYSPAKFANGPEYPLPSNYIPIHLASPGMQVTFSVTAQEEDTDIIAPAKINWYEGAVLLGNVATLTRNFETPGSYTYTAQVQDEYNQTSTASLTFWVWDSEGYNTFTPVGGAPFGPGTLNGPTSMIGFSNSIVFVIDRGNQRIVKLDRLTSGLTTIGDLPSIATETAVASNTHPFQDIAFTGTTIYSLGNQAGVNSRIQSWDTNNLNSSTRDYTIPDGNLSTQFKNPFGFCVDANAIYVADTDNNRIKKLDITNGVFFSESQALSTPRDINLINATTLGVSEYGNDKVLRFGNDLNSVASWLSQTVNNPTNFAYSTSGNTYVTDQTAGTPRVHVINSSGNLIYSFGKNGNGIDRGEFTEPYGIAIIQNDLYVTDRTNNYIIRFRTGAW